MKTKKLECGSVYKGTLADGCVMCAEGSKMVLFVTGKCTTGCSYCPVSAERMGKDVIYANEAHVNDFSEIIDEAESMDAKGTGITGGDPLLDMDRTLKIIHLLKDRFGREHHIHLYTSTLDPEKVKLLAGAGLDEIRFHPPAETWCSISETPLPEIMKIENISIGLEIPALPDKKNDMLALIKDASELGVHFININELEFSESNWNMMERFGYELKDDLSSAVLGSEQIALECVFASSVPIHFCSSVFKDSVQLRRRLIRRAEHTAKPYDIITEDGTILKGLLYTDDIENTMDLLKNEYDVPDELMFPDPEKKRLEVAAWILEEIASELPYGCYISEQYPTADGLEVERIPLNRK